MDDSTKKDKEGGSSEESSEATRARNRTVMLSRDVTGQVRARLQPGEASRSQGEQGDQNPSMRRLAKVPSHGQKIAPTKRTPIMGFLVSYDVDEVGEVTPLHTGRLIVSSEEVGSGNHLLVQDESVSPMHAIIRVNSQGEIQVLDQLSENGTTIRRATGEVVELSGDKAAVFHGDVISFGNRKFHICLVKRN